jgi:hypothetical protein
MTRRNLSKAGADIYEGIIVLCGKDIGIKFNRYSRVIICNAPDTVFVFFFFKS